MAGIKIKKEILEKYKNKEITRKEIKKLLNIPINSINTAIYRNKIEIWDRKKAMAVDNQMFYNDIKLLRKKKTTVEKIAKKYGIKESTVKLKAKKMEELERKRKYFNWDELKNNIMVSYNQ